MVYGFFHAMLTARGNRIFTLGYKRNYTPGEPLLSLVLNMLLLYHSSHETEPKIAFVYSILGKIVKSRQMRRK